MLLGYIGEYRSEKLICYYNFYAPFKYPLNLLFKYYLFCFFSQDSKNFIEGKFTIVSKKNI